MPQKLKSMDDALMAMISEMDHPVKRLAMRSTRTTVRLTQRTLEALDYLKEKLGFKTREAISTAIDTFCNEDVLRNADKFDPDFFDYIVRKSVVVSPESLKKLNDASERTSLTRDAILNVFLQLLLLAFQKMEEERPAHLNSILEELHKLGAELMNFEKRVEELLDPDDPVARRLGNIVSVTDNLISDLNNEIQNGEPVDPDKT